MAGGCIHWDDVDLWKITWQNVALCKHETNVHPFGGYRAKTRRKQWNALIRKQSTELCTVLARPTLHTHTHTHTHQSTGHFIASCIIYSISSIIWICKESGSQHRTHFFRLLICTSLCLLHWSAACPFQPQALRYLSSTAGTEMT
jgi:hypothetical protein